MVTSLQVYYTEGLEVEFGMTSLAWAALLVDPGTQDVVSHGAIPLRRRREEILYDTWQVDSTPHCP